jgi:hypothetical protein
MLCKSWDLHCGGEGECGLLGYNSPVRTTQETYVSTAETIRLMLCKIWVFHGGDYDECRPPGCYAVWLLQEPTFHSVFRLLVAANAVPSSTVLVIRMMEAMPSSKTPALPNVTRRHIPEDGNTVLKTIRTSSSLHLAFCQTNATRDLPP